MYPHQLLSGLAPAYLANHINFVTDSDHHLLQSAADTTCVATSTHDPSPTTASLLPLSR